MEGLDLAPLFLKSGVTTAYFQEFGNTPVFKEQEKICMSGSTKESAQFLSRVAGIPSEPVAFVVSTNLSRLALLCALLLGFARLLPSKG